MATLKQDHSPYRAIAKAYDGILTLTGFKRGIERFLDRLDFDLPPKARILDAGCGTGLVAKYLAKRFPQAEVCAFDIDRAMLAAMTRQLERDGVGTGNIILAEGNITVPERIRKFPSNDIIAIPRDYFDAIFVSGALEHVPIAEAVPRLMKLLKPGGAFLNIGVRRNPAGAVLGMVYRFRPYRLADLRRACEEAGLTEIRTLRLSVEDFPANLSRIAILAKKRN